MRVNSVTDVKVCSKCGEEKSLDEFYRNTSSVDGHRPDCIECNLESQKARKERDPEAFKALARERVWKHHLTKQYSMTVDEYDALLLAQDGKCAICQSDKSKTSRTDRMHVDHDHATGEVRGLLCDSCNVGLGRFEDDPNLLIAAAMYLVKGDD